MVKNTNIVLWLCAVGACIICKHKINRIDYFSLSLKKQEFFWEKSIILYCHCFAKEPCYCLVLQAKPARSIERRLLKRSQYNSWEFMWLLLNRKLYFSLSVQLLKFNLRLSRQFKVSLQLIKWNLATPATPCMLRDGCIEEGWIHKERQRSSRLFGGQILFNSLPC